MKHFSTALCLFLLLSTACRAELDRSADEPVWQGKTLSEWAAALKDPDVQVRRRAASALWSIGPKVKPVMPALQEAIKDADPSVRQYSAFALAHFGSAALPSLMELFDVEETRQIAGQALFQMGAAAVPELLKRLQDPDVKRRRSVVGMVNSFERHSKEIKPALHRAIRDPDMEVRLRAASTLRYVDRDSTEPLDVFIDALRDKDPVIRGRVIDELENYGSLDETGIRALRRMMKEESGVMRIRVIRALWAIHGEDRAVLTPLLMAAIRGKNEEECTAAMQTFYPRHVRDPDEVQPFLPAIFDILKNRGQYRMETVRLALWVVQTVKRDSKEIVPLFLEIANESDPALLEEVVRWLPFNAPKDPAIPPLLVRAMGHKDPKVRIAAGHSLGRKGLQVKEAIPLLIEALKDSKNPQLGWLAASALGEYGTDAATAVPALKQALNDKDLSLRINAACSLCRIDVRESSAVFPILLRTLANPDMSYQHVVNETLRKMGPDGMNELIRGLKHEDKEQRLGAVRALHDFGPKAKPAVPALKEALRDTDSAVRIWAAAALSRVEMPPEELTAVLIAGITSRDLWLRQQAIGAVANLGANGRPAVPALIRILQDKEDVPRQGSAANALGAIGPNAAAAVPALAEAVKDGDSETRGAALNALGRIGAPDKALVPFVVEAMLAGGDHVSPYAHDVLRKAGADAIPPLVKALKDKDPDKRVLAAGLILNTNAGPSDEVRDALEAAMKDDVPRVRLTAALSFLLVEHGSRANAQKVLFVVKDALKSENAATRAHAVSVLRHLATLNVPGPAPEAAPLLVEQLKDNSHVVRRAAFHALRSVYPPPKEAFQPALDALQGNDPEVIERAAELIQQLRPTGKDAIPALLKVLRARTEENLQYRVIGVLTSIGRDDQEVADALIDVLKSSGNARIRDTIMSGLIGFGAKAEKALPVIVESLKDERTRRAAMHALARIDPQNKLLPTALADDLGKEQYHEIYRYPGRDEDKMKPLAPETAKAFGELLLKDPDPARRAGAARAIATLVKSGPGLDKPLREALKDNHIRVRLYAAEALWVVARDGAATGPVITAALKDKDIAIRNQAVTLLRALGPEAKGATADLAEALKDEQMSYVALGALKAIGPDSSAAVPAIIELLERDKRLHVLVEAAWTLSNYGPQAQEAVPQLLKMMKTVDRDHRSVFARALGKIGPTEKVLPAILDLIREFKEEDDRSALPHMVRDALTALGPEVCAPLAKLLKEKEPAVRRLTADLLSAFGDKAVGEVPDLLPVLDDKDEDTAVRAAWAVWFIDKRKEALPALIRGLKAKSPNTRFSAARGLLFMGDDAKPALPDITTACRDRDRTVRREAYQLLRRLDPDTAATLPDPDTE